MYLKLEDLEYLVERWNIFINQNPGEYQIFELLSVVYSIPVRLLA